MPTSDEVNAECGLNITWEADGAAAMPGGKRYGMFRGVRSMLLKGGAELPRRLEALVLSGALGGCAGPSDSGASKS